MCHGQALSVTEAFAPSLLLLTIIHPSPSLRSLPSQPGRPSEVTVADASVQECIQSPPSVHGRVTTKLISWPFETPASRARTL